MSNYPPGVTGREYAIAGPDYERESDTPCPRCGQWTLEQGYGADRWLVCDKGHVTDLPRDESDPDIAYDERRDRQLEELDREH